MFYAIFLTTLPMVLREHINTYLGDRTKILFNEAKWLDNLISFLYMVFCETSIRVSLYYFLPKQEFRTLLFGLYDLRLEFMEKLGEIVGNSKEFFKKQYDCLFTRATMLVITEYVCRFNQSLGRIIQYNYYYVLRCLSDKIAGKPL